jgi:hypothetical protein
VAATSRPPVVELGRLLLGKAADANPWSRVVPPMTGGAGAFENEAMNISGAPREIGSGSVDRFLRLAKASSPFQHQLSRCGHADQLLELARRNRVPLSRQDLVLLAMTATQPYLPWAGRSKQFARAYALGAARLDPNPSAHHCPAA